MICVNARFLAKRITGVERYASEISLALIKIDPEIFILSPHNVLKNPHSASFKVIELGFTKDYLWEQIELPLFLKQNNNPVLINLTNTAPIFYNNQITVIHDLAFIHYPEWYTKKAALFFKLLVSQSAKVSKRIITVSHFSKQEIIKYLNIPSEKIIVIPEAVPTNILRLREKKYLNNYGGYILSVSSIEPRKNLINLIEAFIKLNRPDIKLIVVGDVNKNVFNKVKLDFAKNKKNILFLGYVSDEVLVSLYKNARLFAYLSYYEGFGLPPLEALSCGCPTLVSNTSSLREVCGNGAYYCDPYDIEDITDKMEKILTDKLIIEPEDAKAITEKYNWHKSAKMILDVAAELS